VFTSLRTKSDDLVDHFIKQGLISWDLMSLYAKRERKQVPTNGETLELVTGCQTQLDEQQLNGNTFVPYVRSCAGWTF
jgi:hypothetical protein